MRSMRLTAAGVNSCSAIAGASAPSADGPSSNPTASSPTTGGCPIRRTSRPPASASPIAMTAFNAERGSNAWVIKSARETSNSRGKYSYYEER
jgi:hypothetical protein